jgi:hypothetical protein
MIFYPCVPIVGSWNKHVWLERNKIVFELKELHPVEVANKAQKLVWEYITSHIHLLNLGGTYMV